MATDQIVSFDVGGTLVDIQGEGFSRQVCDVVGCNLEALQPLIVRHFLTRNTTLASAVRSFCDELGSDRVDAILSAYSKARPFVYLDVKGVLSTLKSRGFKIISISNCSSWESGDLEKLGLRQYFCECFQSFSVGHAKPDQEIFRYVERVMKAPGTAFVHVGDSWKADVLGPRAAGWHVCALQRPGTVVLPPEKNVPIISTLYELPSVLNDILVGQA